jgi:hypothetical protein
VLAGGLSIENLRKLGGIMLDAGGPSKGAPQVALKWLSQTLVHA